MAKKQVLFDDSSFQLSDDAFSSLDAAFFPGEVVAAEPDTEKDEEGGLVNSAMQVVGSTIKGAGQLASDFLPVDRDNAASRFGQQIIDDNPTAVHGFSDFGDKPTTGVAEAVGNAGGSMAGMIGVRALGQGITVAAPLTGPAAPLVAGLGQLVAWAGPAAIAALPSYSGIRDKQIFNDPTAENDAKAKAAAVLGAGTVGFIEQRFGPQQWALSMMTKEGRASLAEKLATDTVTGALLKGAAKGAVVEGAEELVQNPVEQLAAFDDPLTKENLSDTAFAGFMGAVGGGVLGGGTQAIQHHLRKIQDAPTLDDAIKSAEEMAADITGPGREVAAADLDATTEQAIAGVESDYEGLLLQNPARQLPNLNGPTLTADAEGRVGTADQIEQARLDAMVQPADPAVEPPVKMAERTGTTPPDSALPIIGQEATSTDTPVLITPQEQSRLDTIVAKQRAGELLTSDEANFMRRFEREAKAESPIVTKFSESDRTAMAEKANAEVGAITKSKGHLGFVPATPESPVVMEVVARQDGKLGVADVGKAIDGETGNRFTRSMMADTPENRTRLLSELGATRFREAADQAAIDRISGLESSTTTETTSATQATQAQSSAPVQAVQQAPQSRNTLPGDVTTDAKLTEVLRQRKGWTGTAREVIPGQTAVNALGTRQTSKPEAAIIRTIGKLFGTNIRFFEADSMDPTPDGFYRSGKTVWINVNSGVSALSVAGHEFTHQLRGQDAQAHTALIRGVGTILRSNPKRLQAFVDYYDKNNRYGWKDAQGAIRTDLSQDEYDHISDEIASDLNGDMWRDSGYWREVFDEINKAHQPSIAKQIITKIGTALVKMIDRLIVASPKQGFSTADKIGLTRDELKSIRGMLVTEMKNAFVREELSRAKGQPMYRGDGLDRGVVRESDYRDLVAAKEDAAERREKFRSTDERARMRSLGAEEYFKITDELIESESALIDKLTALPDEEALQGRTKDGRLLILNQSAQQPGKWQLTRFDQNGKPWGDTQYGTKKQAVKELVQEADIQSVTDYEKRFSEQRGINIEVAPDPRDTQAKQAFDALPEGGKKAVTYVVSQKILPKLMADMGIKGRIEYTIGGFAGGTQPAIIVHFDDSVSYDDVREFAIVSGALFRQQAAISYDENDTTDGTYFVSVVTSRQLSYDEQRDLFEHINDQYPEAKGFTGRNGRLVFGNFPDHENGGAKPDDADFLQGIQSAVESYQADYTAKLDAKTFRSDWHERNDGQPLNFEGTRYEGNVSNARQQGAVLRGQGFIGALQAESDRLVREEIGASEPRSNPDTDLATHLDQAGVTGKDRLDVIRDVRSGALTLEDVKAAYPISGKVDSFPEKNETRFSESNRAAVDELNAAIEKQEGIKNAFRPSELGDKNLVSAFKKIFGTDIIPVAGQDGFLGMHFNGRIYVNAEHDHAGFVQIAGHELLHDIARKAPDLYAYFATQARAFGALGAEAHYRGRLEASGADAGTDTYQEILADFVGDSLTDDRFLRMMARTNPSRWVEFVSLVTKWLDRVKSKLRQLNLGSSQYFTDVDEVQRHLAGVLDAYAEMSEPEEDLDFTQPVTRTLAEEWQRIADIDGYVYGRSDEKDIIALFDELMPDAHISEVTRMYDTELKKGQRKYRIAVPYVNEQTGRIGYDDGYIYVDPNDNRVWISVDQLKGQGKGSEVYSAVANWAYNNAGYRFIGDPADISVAGMKRRMENMVASALKFKTTRHLGIHPKMQGFWEQETGKKIDDKNLEGLLRASYDMVRKDFPGVKNVIYRDGTYINANSGKELSEGALEYIAGQLHSRSDPTRAQGAPGLRTIRRAAITNTLLRGGADALALGQSQSPVSGTADGRRAAPRDRLVYSEARDELQDTPADATIDADRLANLRRQAARLERPESGVLLYVTNDGQAIATGPKGAKIPESFRAFAAKEGLTFQAQRKLPSRYTLAGHELALGPSERMSAGYREGGAKYAGEMGDSFLDRTERTRFSETDRGETEYDPHDAFWQGIESGKNKWSDKEIVDAYGIGRRGTVRKGVAQDARRDPAQSTMVGEAASGKAEISPRSQRSGGDLSGRTRTSEGAAQAVVHWLEPVAGFKSYDSSAQLLGSDRLAVHFYPGDQFADTSKLHRKSFATYIFTEHPNGRFRLDINGPENDYAIATLLKAKGRWEVANEDYNRVKFDDRFKTSRAWLQEAVRRLALHSGRVPEVYQAGRETGARTGSTEERSFPPETVRANFSEPRNQPWYYSALEDGVRNQVPKHLQTQSAKSWAAWLTGNTNKIGAKKDELEWSGVLDWLNAQGGEKLASAQVADWLTENGVRVEEVVLGDARNGADEWEVVRNGPEDYDVVDGSGTAIESGFLARQSAQEFIADETKKAGSTKHASGNLVLPGGTDHREIVLTVPTIEPYNESDTTHYGDTGKGKAIAWARVNTRTDANGKKVLFVEEIQSQRGQHGRKKGFGVAPEISVVAPEEEGENWSVMIGGREVGYVSADDEAEAMRAATRNFGGSKMAEGVPTAPFVSTRDGKPTDAYIALTLKRLIAYAVETGHNSVAWTTGEQQADRYDLSKQISMVVYRPSMQRLIAYGLDDQKVIEEFGVPPERITDYIGKDAADKLLARPLDAFGEQELQGLDLKVGGGWTAQMYGDATGNNAQGKPGMIAAAARKLGAEVSAVDFGKTEQQKRWDAEGAEYSAATQQPGFTITDTMREQAGGKGIPLFSEFRQVDTESPEFKRWFGDWQDPKAFSSKYPADKTPVSHAVNTDGTPMRLYHATNNDFSAFETGRDSITSTTFGDFETKRHAIFTTPDVKFAEEYLKKTGGQNVMPVFMDIKSPMDLRNNKAWDYVDELKENGFPGIRWPNMPDTQLWEMFDDETGEQFVAAAKKAGYDGAIMYEVNADDKMVEVWVAFDPTQIKSAISNTGEFSDTNPDIRYSLPRVAKHLTEEATPAPEAINNAGRLLKDFGHFESSATESEGQPSLAGGRYESIAPRNSEARSAITGDPISAAWESPGTMPQWDNLVRHLQDKLIDTKRVVAAIKEKAGDVFEGFDPYLQELLYHGRAAKRVTEFKDQVLEPLLKDMGIRGIKLQEFDDYLWARHAAERNAQIAKINPAYPDGGSGLTDQEATDVLAGKAVSKDGRVIQLRPNMMQAYAAMAKKVDAINQGTLDLLVDYDLESQETVDAWRTTYSKYAPLKRDMDADDNYAGAFGLGGTGRGFDVRGSMTKRAMGSERSVIDVLANVAMQRERAIIKGEKNRISRAVYGLALTAPNPDFWLPINPEATKDVTKTVAELQRLDPNLTDVEAENIAKEPTQRAINKTTGMVEHRINANLRSRDDVIALRINGKDRFVMFSNDARAQEMVRGLKNLSAENLGWALQNVAKVTRFMASINTQFNPIFGMTNGIRDFGTGMLNLSSTPLALDRATVAKQVWPALRGIYADLRDRRAGKQPTSQWAQWFEEFARAGGQTGYMDSFANSLDRAEDMAKEMQQAMKGEPLWKVFSEKSAIGGWLSDYNTSIENAVRLAAYRTARDKGFTEAKAAALAKNLTVNFNKKGQVATQAGALYAFFNAAVQGTARIGETMVKDGKITEAGKKIAMGGVVLGVMQAVLAMLAGWDDEEPPQFIREKNLLIPIGGGKYIQIPMPLGFHVIPGVGRIAGEFALGGFKKPSERMQQMISLVTDAFNPLGSSTALQTLAPTVVDPLAAIAENKDWSGKPIAKEDFSAMKPTAGWTRAKDTATPWAKGISYALNYASGGGKYGIGSLSPTPDQVDYLIGVATGGVGREVGKLSQTARSAVTGEELPIHKVPVAGRFIGSTTGQASEMARFYSNLKRIGAHDSALDEMNDAKDSEAREEYLAENPDAKLVALADKAQRELGYLKRQKRAAVEKGDTDAVKRMEQRITDAVKRWNSKLSLSQ